MQCWFCGNETPDGSLFCEHCGTPLTEGRPDEGASRLESLVDPSSFLSVPLGGSAEQPALDEEQSAFSGEGSAFDEEQRALDAEQASLDGERAVSDDEQSAFGDEAFGSADILEQAAFDEEPPSLESGFEPDSSALEPHGLANATEPADSAGNSVDGGFTAASGETFLPVETGGYADQLSFESYVPAVYRGPNDAYPVEPASGPVQPKLNNRYVAIIAVIATLFSAAVILLAFALTIRFLGL